MRGRDDRAVKVAIIGSAANEATARLAAAWREEGIDCALLSGADALRTLSPGDVAVTRLDVRPALDGVEDGLLSVLMLERSGVEVFNTVESLLRAHDKLRTARVLEASFVPHPRTKHLTRAGALGRLRFPVVLKPRFGSWGRDIVLCENAGAAAARLAEFESRPWFRRHGVLVQEAIPSPGHDLRVVVAGGRVVGAVKRTAAPGEWRTNVSCGGTVEPVLLAPEAAELARTATAVLGADLMGVDLMPLGGDRFVVLEVNAAVEFDETYSLPGMNVDLDAFEALLRTSSRHVRAGRRVAPATAVRTLRAEVVNG